MSGYRVELSGDITLDIEFAENCALLHTLYAGAGSHVMLSERDMRELARELVAAADALAAERVPMEAPPF